MRLFSCPGSQASAGRVCTGVFQNILGGGEVSLRTCAGSGFGFGGGWSGHGGGVGVSVWVALWWWCAGRFGGNKIV